MFQSKQGHKAPRHFHVAILYYLHEYPGLGSATPSMKPPNPQKNIRSRYTDKREHNIILNDKAHVTLTTYNIECRPSCV